MPATRPAPRAAKAAAPSARDLYAEVTDRIAAALAEGVAPWAPSHTAAPLALPRNGATGRPYSGVNVLLLWLTAAQRGYAAPTWYTFNQARQAGGCVRKGERGTLVTFWRDISREDKTTGERTRVPLLRHFVVFNTAQIDGLPAAPEAEAARTPWERTAAAEALVWRHSVRVIDGAPGPCYRQDTDTVHMPAASAYPEREGYYVDLLHEVTHWTGHPARLARPAFAAGVAVVPGSDVYAREELVAELGSAFVRAALGLPGKGTHAEYIGAWLRTMREDSRAIFRAASDARKAAEYLTGGGAADEGEGEDA